MDVPARLAACLSAAAVTELQGGHQARVFEVAYPDGGRAIAKVLDASLVDAGDVATRAQVVADLADIDHRVCRPVPVGGDLVGRITVGSFVGLVTCYEFAEGDAIDITNSLDAWRMGRALAQLHDSMKRLATCDLPVVAALGVGDPVANEPPQLLHGDFNAGNLRQLDGEIKIFDFDDCGYGPPAFDVANALYMVLFDATVGRRPDMYRTFEQAFVSGYTDSTAHAIDAADVAQHIDRRVDAVASWLADLSTAPTGIRTASPAWHEVLRSFVSDYRTRGRLP